MKLFNSREIKFLINFMLKAYLICLFVEVNGKINESIKFNVYSNKNVNETELNNYLVKSIKSPNKFLCVSDCIKLDTCNLITFNKRNQNCQYYYNFNLTNPKNLIDSNEITTYYSPPSPYDVTGTQLYNKTIGCGAYSSIELPNRNIAFGCLGNNILIYDPVDWKLVSILNGHTNWIPTLAVLINGNLASGSSDNTIKIWDLSTGKIIKTLVEHTSYITKIIQLKNGDLASASDDKLIKIWDLNSGLVKFNFTGHTNRAYDLIQLKNGNLVSGGWEKILIIMNSKNGSIIWSGNINQIIFRIIQLNNGDLVVGTYGGVIQIRDSNTVALKYSLTGHTSTIFNMILLKNGDMATCSLDYTVRIWDMNKMVLKKTLTDHTSNVYGLIQLRNIGYLISSGRDSKAIVWK